MLIVCGAKRINVPTLICAGSALLNVRTNRVLVGTADRLAVVGRLTTEFLPMVYPTAAFAGVITRTIDVLYFHDSLLGD